MADVKAWWQSKTIQAAIAAAVIAGVSTYFGEANPIVTGLIAVCSAFGIYGRVNATTQIGSS